MRGFREYCFRRNNPPFPRFIKTHARFMNVLAAVEEANQGAAIEKKFTGHGAAFLSDGLDGERPNRTHRFATTR
jgi:hypothetical protein